MTNGRWISSKSLSSPAYKVRVCMFLCYSFNHKCYQAFISPILFVKMSCCGGNCGCGTGCKCGSGCGGCKMYPDMSLSETITKETLVLGVAPEKGHFEGAAETVVGAESGCKCGANCACDPCTCK